MASFRSLIGGNSGGSGNSKKQQQQQNDDVEFLLKTIDEQNEQLTRLQNKFRDVTHAYKSLLAEKKALEITLKTLKTSPATFSKPAANLPAKQTNQLSASSRSVSVSDVSELEYPVNSNEASANEASSQVSVASSPDSNDKSGARDLGASAEEKIAALTANIQILMESKSTMEQNYLAEKKKLRADIEELKSRIENSKSGQDKVIESYESKLKELKTSLKQSQGDREKLVQDLNAMIKTKNSEQDSKIMSMNEENQSILLNLRNENNELKGKLKNLTKQFENKCEEVIQCDKDYKQLKSFNEQQTREYENRISELNSQIQDLTGSSEMRINDLEAKISDMCKTIATYESANAKELNSSLNKSLNGTGKKLNDDEPTKASLDFDTAIEQISQLKSFIESTARDLNINFNFNEIWLQPGLNCQQQQQQKELQEQLDKLKEENRSLREEYEKYKIRTNYLIKSAKQSSKEPTPTPSNQEEELQQQVKRLKDEVEVYKKRILLIEKENHDEIKTLNEAHDTEMHNVRNEFRLKLEKSENEKMKSITDLEKELVKQRERTIKLLTEKDAEVQRYRDSNVTMTPTFASVFSDKSPVFKKDDNAEHAEHVALTESEDEPHDLLNKLHTPNLKQPSNNSNLSTEAGRLIYYTQEAAYKDLELNKLRIAKNELEYQLKQTIDEHSVDVDRFQSQMAVLKQEIERLKLNQTRNEMNGANLEYVKNVVFNFITTKDKNVKIAMINAITQILQFTKAEKQRIQSISNKL